MRLWECLLLLAIIIMAIALTIGAFLAVFGP